MNNNNLEILFDRIGLPKNSDTRAHAAKLIGALVDKKVAESYTRGYNHGYHNGNYSGRYTILSGLASNGFVIGEGDREFYRKWFDDLWRNHKEFEDITNPQKPGKEEKKL